ncbi:Prostaglandin F synthase [Durusdinium trenchii]|uniref:Prostaglandin F synthase n=1 Tax=Durusdinium trenchii TaxID=1381693 RepID=A0ABP0L8P6_9DINO
MGSVWSSDDSDEWEDSGEEWSISFLYSVVKGEAIGDDADYYSDGAWCDKCGDNAGLEADLYCVDCEAYFCWSCSGRWHHPGGCNELHSLEHIVKDESKGLRILTPLLDELLVGLAAYLLISGLREYVDKDYLRRSDICPGIRTLQDGLAWVDTLLFYHFKDTLMTSCSTEDNFWKLLLDSWVRTVLTDSDSLLLLLRTLPNALLIHYMARTFIVPPFAVAYAVLLVVVRSLEARLPRTRLLRFLASLAQRVSALSARFVSYNLQAPAKTLPRVRPSQDLGEWWVYWSGRQVRWFHFYYSAAKECTTLLLANVMRLTVLFRCLGLLLGVGKLVRWLLDMAGLQEEIRMQQSWFQSVHHMWDTDQLLWQGLASSVMMTTELVKRADARGIAVVLLGAAFLIAFDVLLRFGIVRKRWFYQRGVQRSVLLPLLVVLVVVPTARFGFFLVYFGLAIVLWQAEKLISYVTELQHNWFWKQWEEHYRALTLGQCPSSDGELCPCPCTHPRDAPASRRVRPPIPLPTPRWLRRLRRRACKRSCKRRRGARTSASRESLASEASTAS